MDTSQDGKDNLRYRNETRMHEPCAWESHDNLHSVASCKLSMEE